MKVKVPVQSKVIHFNTFNLYILMDLACLGCHLVEQTLHFFYGTASSRSKWFREVKHKKTSQMTVQSDYSEIP